MSKLRLDAPLGRAVSEVIELGSRAAHLQVADAPALSRAVVDHFAAGDYDEGVKLLMAGAKGPKSKLVLRNLTESALLSLGVNPQQARTGLRSALQQLASTGETLAASEPIELRASPIRDAFRGLRFPLDDASLTTIKLQALGQARLETSLAAALKAPDKLAALRELRAAIDPANTPDFVLMGMLKGFHDCEAWPDLVAMFEASPADFRAQYAPRREYALALHQSGQHRRAREAVRALVLDGDMSTGTLGLQGRMFKDSYDRAKAHGDSNAPALLDAAIRAYRSGYERDRVGLYPAVALPVLLEEQGTAAAKAEAKALATVVLYNAERRHRFGERHYWDAAAALEMACVLGDRKQQTRWLAETTRCAAEPWMLEASATNLARLGRVRGTHVFDGIILALRERAAGSTTGLAPASPAPSDAEPLLAAVTKQSYRFGGRSSKWMSGNYSFSGIAHDIRVAPSDVTYFKRVAEHAGLFSIKDPLAVSAAIDQVMRARFGTAHLEDLHSPEHKRYDQIMPGLAKLLAASSANSQTNVSADWLNGLADCRQHAPVKLMLWEAWKRQRTSDLLGQMHGQDGARLRELQQELDAVTKWDMRIADMQVVDKDTAKVREEHTMTILVKRKASASGALDGVDEIHLADAFYHEVYPLGAGVTHSAVIDGKLHLEVPAPAADGKAIVLIAAPYSFDRSAQSYDYGQLAFRGRTVATPGWEHDVPVTGLALSELHDAAALLGPTKPTS